MVDRNSKLFQKWMQEKTERVDSSRRKEAEKRVEGLDSDVSK